MTCSRGALPSEGPPCGAIARGVLTARATTRKGAAPALVNSVRLRETPGPMEPMISSDSHIVEPPDLWERWLDARVPPARAEAGEGRGGRRRLALQRRRRPRAARPGHRHARPAARGAALVGRPLRHDQPGQLRRRRRASTEMLEDGVVAEVIYSPQRTMRHFMLGTEDDFHLAGIRAYNDWLAKDFCAKAPDRLIGIAQMPSVGVDARDRRDAALQGDGAARRPALGVAERQPEPLRRPTTRSSPRPSGSACRSASTSGSPSRAKVAAEAEDAARGEGGARRGHGRPAGVGALRRRPRHHAAPAGRDHPHRRPRPLPEAQLRVGRGGHRLGAVLPRADGRPLRPQPVTGRR